MSADVKKDFISSDGDSSETDEDDDLKSYLIKEKMPQTKVLLMEKLKISREHADNFKKNSSLVCQNNIDVNNELQVDVNQDVCNINTDHETKDINKETESNITGSREHFRTREEMNIIETKSNLTGSREHFRTKEEMNIFETELKSKLHMTETHSLPGQAKNRYYLINEQDWNKLTDLNKLQEVKKRAPENKDDTIPSELHSDAGMSNGADSKTRIPPVIKRKMVSKAAFIYIQQKLKLSPKKCSADKSPPFLVGDSDDSPVGKNVTLDTCKDGADLVDSNSCTSPDSKTFVLDTSEKEANLNNSEKTEMFPYVNSELKENAEEQTQTDTIPEDDHLSIVTEFSEHNDNARVSSENIEIVFVQMLEDNNLTGNSGSSPCTEIMNAKKCSESVSFSNGRGNNSGTTVKDTIKDEHTCIPNAAILNETDQFCRQDKTLVNEQKPFSVTCPVQKNTHYEYHCATEVGEKESKITTLSPQKLNFEELKLEIALKNVECVSKISESGNVSEIDDDMVEIVNALSEDAETFEKKVLKDINHEKFNGFIATKPGRFVRKNNKLTRVVNVNGQDIEVGLIQSSSLQDEKISEEIAAPDEPPESCDKTDENEHLVRQVDSNHKSDNLNDEGILVAYPVVQDANYFKGDQIQECEMENKYREHDALKSVPKTYVKQWSKSISTESISSTNNAEFGVLDPEDIENDALNEMNEYYNESLYENGPETSIVLKVTRSGELVRVADDNDRVAGDSEREAEDNETIAEDNERVVDDKETEADDKEMVVDDYETEPDDSENQEMVNTPRFNQNQTIVQSGSVNQCDSLEINYVNSSGDSDSDAELEMYFKNGDKNERAKVVIDLSANISTPKQRSLEIPEKDRKNSASLPQEISQTSKIQTIWKQFKPPLKKRSSSTCVSEDKNKSNDVKVETKKSDEDEKDIKSYPSECQLDRNLKNDGNISSDVGIGTLENYLAVSKENKKYAKSLTKGTQVRDLSKQKVAAHSQQFDETYFNSKLAKVKSLIRKGIGEHATEHADHSDAVLDGKGNDSCQNNKVVTSQKTGNVTRNYTKKSYIRQYQYGVKIVPLTDCKKVPKILEQQQVKTNGQTGTTLQKLKGNCTKSDETKDKTFAKAERLSKHLNECHQKSYFIPNIKKKRLTGESEIANRMKTSKMAKSVNDLFGNSDGVLFGKSDNIMAKIDLTGDEKGEIESDGKILQTETCKGNGKTTQVSDSKTTTSVSVKPEKGQTFEKKVMLNMTSSSKMNLMKDEQIMGKKNCIDKSNIITHVTGPTQTHVKSSIGADTGREKIQSSKTTNIFVEKLYERLMTKALPENNKMTEIKNNTNGKCEELGQNENLKASLSEIKKKRGRPRKIDANENTTIKIKRGRGRPKMKPMTSLADSKHTLMPVACVPGSQESLEQNSLYLVSVNTEHKNTGKSLKFEENPTFASKTGANEESETMIEIKNTTNDKSEKLCLYGNLNANISKIKTKVGRPKKVVITDANENTTVKIKRGRGRPKMKPMTSLADSKHTLMPVACVPGSQKSLEQNSLYLVSVNTEHKNTGKSLKFEENPTFASKTCANEESETMIEIRNTTNDKCEKLGLYGNLNANISKIKKKIGRPRKVVITDANENTTVKIKRGRGRPKMKPSTSLADSKHTLMPVACEPDSQNSQEQNSLYLISVNSEHKNTEKSVQFEENSTFDDSKVMNESLLNTDNRESTKVHKEQNSKLLDDNCYKKESNMRKVNDEDIQEQLTKSLSESPLKNIDKYKRGRLNAIITEKFKPENASDKVAVKRKLSDDSCTNIETENSGLKKKRKNLEETIPITQNTLKQNEKISQKPKSKVNEIECSPKLKSVTNKITDSIATSEVESDVHSSESKGVKKGRSISASASEAEHSSKPPSKHKYGLKRAKVLKSRAKLKTALQKFPDDSWKDKLEDEAFKFDFTETMNEKRKPVDVKKLIRTILKNSEGKEKSATKMGEEHLERRKRRKEEKLNRSENVTDKCDDENKGVLISDSDDAWLSDTGNSLGFPGFQFHQIGDIEDKTVVHNEDDTVEGKIHETKSVHFHEEDENLAVYTATKIENNYNRNNLEKFGNISDEGATGLIEFHHSPITGLEDKHFGKPISPQKRDTIVSQQTSPVKTVDKLQTLLSHRKVNSSRAVRNVHISEDKLETMLESQKTSR